jgi:serine/threonine protein phosphatase PrpC
MKLQISAITHPGLVRRKNEDNLCLCQQVLPEDKKEVSLKRKCTKPALLGVFDGMGGYLNGEKASFFAAETASNTTAAGSAPSF